MKSSNGTFINGERLSNEGEESEPRDLNNKDEIEFGIDIVNDNGSSNSKIDERNIRSNYFFF